MLLSVFGGSGCLINQMPETFGLEGTRNIRELRKGVNQYLQQPG